MAPGTPTGSLRSRILGFWRASKDLDIGNLIAAAGEGDKLTWHHRQSKLSQEQLSELQRSTHFDKKELQQWYKGLLLFLPC